MPLLICLPVLLLLIWLYRNSAVGVQVLLRYENDRLHQQRGRLRSVTCAAVEDLLRSAHAAAATITVLRGPRVEFSSSIPPELHQRLRNILLND